MVYGLKKISENGQRIITADKPDGFYLIDVTIFHLDKDYNLKEKDNFKKSKYKR